MNTNILAHLDKMAKRAGMTRSGFIELMATGATCLDQNDFNKMAGFVTSTLMKSMQKVKK